MRAYLDTNILIDYIWWSKFANNPIKEKKTVTLLKNVEKGIFNPIISNFSLIEMANHFRDYFLLRYVIEDGYSYRELHGRKINYRLAPTEEQKIQEILNEFENNESFTIVKVTGWRKKAFSDIELFIKNYIELIDAFHLQVARSLNCKYLITKDEEFRKWVKEMEEQNPKIIKTAVVSVEEFIKHEMSS